MSNAVYSSGYINCYSLSSSGTIKSLTNLSDAIARRSTVGQEDRKPYSKSEKRHIFLFDQQACYL